MKNRNDKCTDGTQESLYAVGKEQTLELRAYYKKLDALIGDIRIFKEQEKQNLNTMEKMHPEVIPFLAYILASCPGIHERIDRVYQSYHMDDPGVEDRYREFGMEELAKTLTPQARVRYREIVMICLYENNQTWKQVFKLLKKAQPNACMEGDGTMYMAAVLTAGAFDTRHIATAWLSLYFNRTTMDFTTPSLDAVVRDFVEHVRRNIPLPYFNEIPEKCKAKTGIRFGDLIGNVAGVTEIFYYRTARATRQILEKEQKQKSAFSKMPKFPLAVQPLPDGPDEFLRPFMQLPNTCTNMMKKALEHPAVAEREDGFSGTVWDEDPEVKKEAKRTFDKEQHNTNADYLFFICSMMQNSGLSVEELYNAEVYPEDLTAVNAACAQQEDVQEEDLGPDMWESLHTWEKIAALLIRILARRAINAENVLEQVLSNIQETGMQSETTQLSVPEIKNGPQKQKDTEEIQMLRTKNRELVTKIGAEKEKSRKLEKEAENRKSALVAENAQLKEMMEQLLSAQETEEDDTDIADKTGEIEAMKKAIVDAGTIFVCGHPSWRTAMKVEFPQSRFIEPREYSVPQSVFRNANFVVYHLQHANHSMYYKCLDFKNKDAKLLFINQNNVNRCIRQIYEYICQNTKKKEEDKAS